MQSPHISVLLNEVRDTFSKINGIFLDCTLGYAGHSFEILKSNKNVNLIACDKDTEAINFSTEKLKCFNDRVEIHKSSFSNLINLLNYEEVKNTKGILADIGVSSLQLDKNERGFGLKSDTLDMRMDKSNTLSAYEVVNCYDRAKLEKIFLEYAELPNYKLLADKIIKKRNLGSIKSAKELCEVIGNSKLKGRNISISTLVFQAIRIEVNQELDELKNLLKNIEKSNLNDCLICIISFHSLEDRIVKQTFKRWQKECICPDHYIKCECGKNNSLGKIITKKAILPTDTEIKQNSRSSCAKMRIFKIKKNNG